MTTALTPSPGVAPTISTAARGRVHSTVPDLASLNLDERVAFYTERLGVLLLALHPCIPASRHPDHAIVARDRCELHFWSCDNPVISQNTSCYVRTANTEAVYQEFKNSGADVKPTETRLSGMKELYVIDSHGGLLTFGEQS